VLGEGYIFEIIQKEMYPHISISQIQNVVIEASFELLASVVICLSPHLTKDHDINTQVRVLFRRKTRSQLFGCAGLVKPPMSK